MSLIFCDKIGKLKPQINLLLNKYEILKNQNTQNFFRQLEIDPKN